MDLCLNHRRKGVHSFVVSFVFNKSGRREREREREFLEPRTLDEVVSIRSDSISENPSSQNAPQHDAYPYVSSLEGPSSPQSAFGSIGYAHSCLLFASNPSFGTTTRPTRCDLVLVGDVLSSSSGLGCEEHEGHDFGGRD